MAIDWRGIISAAAPVASGMAGAMTKNRGEADTNAMSRDRIALEAARLRDDALLGREDLALRQTQDARAAETDALKKALQSALILNTQDASFDRSGFKSPVADIRFSGGSRPSALGPQGRDAASAMNNLALQRLMSGGAGPQSGATGRGSGTPGYQEPSLSEPSKASVWEKALGPIGLGLTALDKIGPSLFGKAPSVTAPGGVPGLPTSTINTSVMDGVGAVGNAGRSVMGGLNSVAGPAAMGAGLIANFMPEGKARSAASGAGMGAQIGSFIPGVGTAIGAGVGVLVGAITGNRNTTKGQREDLAKKLGYRSLDQLYQALEALGPDGQQLRDIGVGVIGKKDKAENAAWMQQVASLLQGRR